MNRRTFMSMAAGAVAANALSGCSVAGVERDLGSFDAATWARARRYARTSYGRIAYVEHGRGEAALFLHGFPLNGYQWRDAMLSLGGQRRCFAPDFLGLGHTEVADGRGVAPDDQVAMLVEFLDALGLSQVDVVASDSGGAVAQWLVARHPARVRTLLLANCDTEIDCPPPSLIPVIDLAREGRFVAEWIAPWHADPVRARSPQGIGGLCYADPAHPTDDAIDIYFAPLVAKPDLAHRYAIALDHNVLAGVETHLRESRVPTRVVWGTADTIFSAASPDYLASVLGASRGVRKLEGSKLFWPEERPDVIAEEARALWASAVA